MFIKAIKLALLLSCCVVLNNSSMQRPTNNNARPRPAWSTQRSALHTSTRAARRPIARQDSSSFLPAVTAPTTSRKSVFVVATSVILQQQTPSAQQSKTFKLPKFKLNLQPVLDEELRKQQALDLEELRKKRIRQLEEELQKMRIQRTKEAVQLEELSRKAAAVQLATLEYERNKLIFPLRESKLCAA